MRTLQKQTLQLGLGTTASALALSLAIGGTAHATPISSAMTLTYSWPSENAADPGNCRLDPIFDSTTTTWRNEIASRNINLGANDATLFWNEISDEFANGNDQDNSNLDTADLVLFATHGSHSGTSAAPTRINFALTTPSGDPDANCIVRTNEMRIGDDQAEFADVFACASGQRGWFGTADFRAATQKLHQYHGFHGTTAVGTGTTTHMDDYLDDAFDGSASWAWVENETSFKHWGGPQDVCAITATRGATESDARNRAGTEYYNGGVNFADPAANSTGVWLQYMCGCESPDGLTGALGC